MAWTGRQLPKDDEVFLDHAGLFVSDMDEAASAFERLGFTISGENTHYNADETGNLVPAGTINRLVTFEAGYLEVLAASSNTPLADQLRNSLSRYPGLHLIAFGHADVAGLAGRLASSGIEILPPVNLRRPIRTAEGEAFVGFTVLRAAPGAMAEGRVQFCQHLTPQHVWQPGQSDHANGATALLDMLLVTPDVEETSRRYERFTGRPARRHDDLTVVDLHRGRITLAAPGKAESLLPGLRIPSLPYCAAVTLGSSDLDLTRTVLGANGVRLAIDRPDLVAIGPDDGLGAWILFTRADSVELA